MNFPLAGNEEFTGKSTEFEPEYPWRMGNLDFYLIDKDQNISEGLADFGLHLIMN